MKKHCKPSWCSARESCVVEIASVDCVSMRRVVTNVAYCYVTMKQKSQKNDVRCEYTRGAAEPLFLQIPIDISVNCW